MKFIHTADLHLGIRISSEYPQNVRERLSEDDLMILPDIIKLAESKNISRIIIAGDLFDSNKVDGAISEFAFSEMRKFNGSFYISPGNHDYLCENSVYKRNLPDNVFLFGEDISLYETDDAYIYGFGFTASHKNKNTFSGFRVKDKAKPSVMVTHTDFLSESFYNPVNVAEISLSGIDYFAAGHIHFASEIKKSGSSVYANSGAPQNLSYKETWDTGVYIVDVSEGFVNVSKEDVSRHRYRNIRVDMSEITDFDEAVSACEGIILKNSPADTLFKLELVGKVKEGVEIDIPALTEKLSPLCLYLRAEKKYTVKYNIDLLGKEESVRGEYVRNVLKLNEGRDGEFIARVIEKGVGVL